MIQLADSICMTLPNVQQRHLHCVQITVLVEMVYHNFQSGTGSSQPDYYKLLGVDSKATDADIKKAYRKKAKESHPDKHPNDKKAAEKFIKIKEAYDFLTGNHSARQLMCHHSFRQRKTSSI